MKLLRTGVVTFLSLTSCTDRHEVKDYGNCQSYASFIAGNPVEKAERDFKISGPQVKFLEIKSDLIGEVGCMNFQADATEYSEKYNARLVDLIIQDKKKSNAGGSGP
jgi:hypothetical protein